MVKPQGEAPRSFGIRPKRSSLPGTTIHPPSRVIASASQPATWGCRHAHLACGGLTMRTTCQLCF